MSKYHFDCHWFGYNGDCTYKGGQCERVCKNWQNEDMYIESLAESETKISLAKLREILNNHTDRLGAIHSSVDLLIKTVKQEYYHKKI